jgi:Nucleoporin FG repeat region
MSSLFGGGAANTQSKSLFGGLNTNQPASAGGLFGSNQPQQQGSLFGNPGATSQTQGQSLFGATNAAKPAGSLFGGSMAPANQQQGGSFFGGLGANTQQQQQQQQQQQPPSLFGASNAPTNAQPSQPAVSNLFTRSGGLFGSSNTQPGVGSSLFGQPAAGLSQPAHGQGRPQPTDSLFEKLHASRIWTENEPIPRRWLPVL